MSDFVFPQQQAMLLSGAVMAGAKLYFYEAGTTTLQATYSDAALTSANANPVVADASGWFGRIYLQADDYKVKLTDASDNTIWTEDTYERLTRRDNDSAARLSQVASNPLDHGAVGDGVADETTEVQAAIDAATGVVDLLGKTYRCDTGLTLASGITLRNGTLDFTNSSSDTFIAATGSLGAGVSLDSDAAIGDSALTADNTNIDREDLLFVQSSTDWSNVNREVGELDRVFSVSGGSTINLMNAVQSAYTTAASATYKKLTPITNVTIDNVIIECSPAASGLGRALYFQYGDRVLVRNCSVEGAKLSGIHVASCADVTIESNTLFHDNAGGAIGIRVENSSRDITIRDNTARAMSIGVQVGRAGSGGGVCRWLNIENNRVHECDMGIHIDDSSQYTRVAGNYIAGSATTLVTGIDASGADYEIINNHIERVDTNGIACAVDVTVQGTEYIRVSGNVLNRCGDSAGDAAILINPNVTGVATGIVECEDNNITGAAGIGIEFDGDLGEVKRLSVCGNSVVGAMVKGIYAHDDGLDAPIVGYSVSGNAVRVDDPAAGSTLTHGIHIDMGSADSSQASICDNILVLGLQIGRGACAASGRGIKMEGTGDITSTVISGNIVTMSTASNGVGIHLDVSSGTGLFTGILITSNRIGVTSTTNGWCVLAEGQFYQSVVSSNLLAISGSSGNSQCLKVAGVSAGDITKLAVNGNIFDGSGASTKVGVIATTGTATSSILNGNVFNGLDTDVTDATPIFTASDSEAS